MVLMPLSGIYQREVAGGRGAWALVVMGFLLVQFRCAKI